MSLASVTRKYDIPHILFFSLAYGLSIGLATLLPATADLVLALWPAGGIGLASLLLLPKRRWPAMAAALYVAGYVADLLLGRSAIACLGFMLANILESTLSALLIDRYCGGGFRLDRLRGIAILIFSALFVNAGTALIGAASAALVSGSSFLEFWFSWWVSDGISILVVTPVLYRIFTLKSVESHRLVRNPFEYPAFFLLWIGTCWFAFNSGSPLAGLSPHPYLLLVLLAWPAMRFGTGGVSMAILLLSAITVSSKAILSGPSPLHGDDTVQRLLFSQSFLAITAITSWLLSASFAEMREAERKEREDHDRLRSLEDNLPEGMTYQVVREPDGRMKFIYISKGVERLIGLRPEEVLADSTLLYGAIIAEDRASVAAAEDESAKLLTTFKVMSRLRRSDGAIRWMHISSSPRRLPDGRILWDGIMLDMTEQVETKLTLDASEHQYSTLLEQAADGIFISDAGGKYLEVNKTGCAMLGYSREELVGKNISDVILPEEIDKQAINYRKLRDGIAFASERTLVRKDGSRLYTEISAKALRDGRVMGIVRDISERKWQDLIMATRARLSEAIDDSETSLLRMTLDAAEELTGSTIGFFHFLDDNQRLLTSRTWSTRTLAGMCTAEDQGSHYDVDEAGVWVDCVRERRAVIHNDYESLPHKKGLPVGHAPVTRELLIPIFRNERIVAILGVGNKAKNYDQEDLTRVTMLADLTWDILEKRNAARELRESEERFATIFRNSPLPTTLTRLDTGIIADANEAALRLLGYRRGDLIGKNVLDLYEARDERRRLLETLSASKDEKSIGFDTRLKKKNGEVFDASSIVEMVHIGGEHYLVVQTQDVTERKHAETELRESEASLRLSQKVAHIGDWSWNTVTNRVAWSDGMFQVFGLPRESFDPNLDNIVERCIHPDDRARVIASNQAVIQRGESATTEYRVVWSDGSVHTVWAVPGASRRNEKGEVTLLTGIVQDITERKAEEEKVARALAEKEILLRELYHRSNNNMQVISAILEFQAQTIGDERLSRAIADAQDRIGSMALVQRKLYEAGDLSHIDLREYIKELVRILSLSYDDRQGRLVFVPDMEEVFVLIDTAIPCGLILNELISNVFKHAYPGGGEGQLLVSLRMEANGLIVLRVADLGVGVPSGFDFFRDGHVGLRNIVGLSASQLKGEVLFDTKKGLACEIRFKDDRYEARI